MLVPSSAGDVLIQATVVKVEMVDQKEGTVATFCVKVSTSHDGYNSFVVRRRFRQFDALHSTLKSSGFKGVPDLPSKQGFGGTSKHRAFLEKRQTGLNTFLAALLNDPAIAISEDLRSFLELNAAEQLFEKLQEKDQNVNDLVREKDQFVNDLVRERDDALEAMRRRLAEETSPSSSLRSQLQDTEAALGEAALEKARHSRAPKLLLPA